MLPCKYRTLCFLIAVHPSNGAYCSLETQLQIRIEAKYQHPLALSGLVILWLFLTFLKIWSYFRTEVPSQQGSRGRSFPEGAIPTMPPNLQTKLPTLQRRWGFSMRARSVSLEVNRADSSNASSVKLLSPWFAILIMHLQLYFDSILTAWPFHSAVQCWHQSVPAWQQRAEDLHILPSVFKAINIVTCCVKPFLPPYERHGRKGTFKQSYIISILLGSPPILVGGNTNSEEKTQRRIVQAFVHNKPVILML